MSLESALSEAHRVATILGQALLLLIAATVVFDIVHVVLHRLSAARSPLLKRLAAMHQTHHDFLDQDLIFRETFAARNLREHVLPEFFTRIVVTLAGLAIAHPVAVGLVLGLQLTQLVVVLAQRGKDTNHISFEQVPAPGLLPLVGPAYHALHHAYPEHHFGSFITLIDRVLGTGTCIQGRRVALTGASGALGAPLRRLLLAAGAADVRALKFGTDFTYDDYGGSDTVLARTDILVLAHGSKREHAMEANCDSFVALIERFRALTRTRKLPVEVWAVGSEIELHPAWGNPELAIYLRSKRAYARHAHRYFHDRGFIYRHICPSAFRSRMGPGLISGETAARWALALIRRGFRYVPVTYTGIAWLNFVPFLLRGWWRSRPAGPERG